MQENKVIDSVRRWVESVVIGLNLCPFAKRELVTDRVRFVESSSTTQEQLLLELHGELERLCADASVETTLLIHPHVLQSFEDYNHFLNCTDDLLAEMELEGIFQIASFHPDYQFADTQTEDAENYTNRSPYPLLHILREDSLEEAIATYPDVDQIPVRNIELMNSMGAQKMRSLFLSCVESTSGQGESFHPTPLS